MSLSIKNKNKRDKIQKTYHRVINLDESQQSNEEDSILIDYPSEVKDFDQNSAEKNILQMSENNLQNSVEQKLHQNSMNIYPVRDVIPMKDQNRASNDKLKNTKSLKMLI